MKDEQLSFNFRAKVAEHWDGGFFYKDISISPGGVWENILILLSKQEFTHIFFVNIDAYIGSKKVGKKTLSLREVALAIASCMATEFYRTKYLELADKVRER